MLVSLETTDITAKACCSSRMVTDTRVNSSLGSTAGLVDLNMHLGVTTRASTGPWCGLGSNGVAMPKIWPMRRTLMEMGRSVGSLGPKS